MKVSIDGVGVRVLLRAGTIVHELPPIWLRERSPEPGEIDARTGQRLFNPHLFPADLRIDVALQTGDTLSVRFSDGHVAEFDCNELRRQITALNLLPSRSMWRSDLNPLPYYPMSRLNTSKGHSGALSDLMKYGFVVVTGIEQSPTALLGVADYFGVSRDHPRGLLNNVEEDSRWLKPVARSVVPHTVDPFRTPVPGFQIVYCSAQDTSVSTSTIVDGLSVVDRLRREAPDAVRLLAEVNVTFRYRDERGDHLAVRPILDTDVNGLVRSIHYNPMLDELPLMSAAVTQRFHVARHRFAELIGHPDFSLSFPLRAGHAIVVDNARVLHGHDPAAQDTGIQVCRLEIDGPSSKFRALSRSTRSERRVSSGLNR